MKNPFGTETRRIALSLATQAISSGTTFGLNVTLMAFLSAEQFGLFGLGFSSCLLVLGIANAALLTPMVVNLPSQEKREEFRSQILGLTYTFSLIAFVLAAILTGVAVTTELLPSDLAKVLPCVLAVSAGYVIREFYVRNSYSEGREELPLVMAMVTALTIVALESLEVNYIRSDSAIVHLGLLGVGISAGSIIGAFRDPAKSGRLFTKRSWQTVVMLWPDTKWSLLGVVVIWTQTQAFLFLAAFFSGLAGAGEAGASRLFVAPVLLAMPALAQVFLPKMARMAQTDLLGTWNYAKHNTTLLMSCAAIYSGLILVALNESWIPIGVQYGELNQLVLAWCGVLICQVFRDGASTALLALKSFRAITILNILTIFPSLAVTAALAARWETTGILVGAAIAELSLGFALWHKLRRTIERV